MDTLEFKPKPELHSPNPPPRPRSPSVEDVKPKVKDEWETSGQLTLFKQQADKIATDFLKSKKINLRKGAVRKGALRDSKVAFALSGRKIADAVAGLSNRTDGLKEDRRQEA
jgi:hypothetical protein